MDIITHTFITSSSGYTFAWAKYGEFDVIMLDNGYVNANHLCKKEKKEFRFWLRNDHAQELVDHVTKMELTPIIEITKAPNEVKGQYVHPLLVPHIASWVSPSFAIWVSMIVNDHILNEYKKEVIAKDKALRKYKRKMADTDILLGEKETLIHKKDKKISSLFAQLKEAQDLMNKKVDDIHTDLTFANDNLVLANDKLDDAHVELVDVKCDLSEVKTKLGIAVVDRVVPAFQSSKSEILALIKLDEPLSIEDKEYPYFIAKRQRGTFSACVSKHRGPILIKIECQPNAQNLFNRIREVLHEKAGFYHGHICLKNISERRLVKTIKSLDEKKNDLLKPSPFLNMTCPELRREWQKRGMSGFSRLTKDKLISELIEYEAKKGKVN